MENLLLCVQLSIVSVRDTIKNVIDIFERNDTPEKDVWGDNWLCRGRGPQALDLIIVPMSEYKITRP